jgi:hypothetical protein
VHHLTQTPTTWTIAGYQLVEAGRAAYPTSQAAQCSEQRRTAQTAHALAAAGTWLAAHPGLPKLADSYQVSPHGDATVVEAHPCTAHGVEVLAAWAAATDSALEVTPRGPERPLHFEVRVPLADDVTIVLTTDQWLPPTLSGAAR